MNIFNRIIMIILLLCLFVSSVVIAVNIFTDLFAWENVFDRILRSIEKGNTTLASISEDTGIDEKTLNWHLRILEDGFCVEKTTAGDQEGYSLTQEGLVVEYLDR